jgi:IclR family transcriptional regulator, acetate operon repressor
MGLVSHYMSQTTSPPTGTQAIDRAAELLVRLIESDHAWSTVDLADEVGLPKSTASRLLRALERQELVQRDPDRGTLRPGSVLVQYARRGAGNLDLVALARPTLDRLAEASKETVNLAVPSGSGVETVAQVDSGYILGATNWVGRQLVLHASALGKVLQAAGAAPVAAELEAATPQTIVDLGALQRDLALVRQRGYATSIEELEPGLLAVAAGVRERSGAVIAALAVSGPSIRLDAHDLDRLGTLLVVEAGALSERLGYRQREEGAA